MDRETTLIHYRNQLMVKLITIFYVISVVLNGILFPYILPVIIPTGITLCAIIIFLVWKKINVRFTMYVIVSAVFSYFCIITYFDPILVNFIYLWMALIVSLIYKDYRPTLLATFLIVFFSTIFFYLYIDEIFAANTHPLDIIYINLFTVLVAIVLISSSRITERLRIKAEMNEQKTAEELSMTKEYLESFINNTTDAIIVHDINGKAILVNKAFELLYGWSEDELINNQVTVVLEKDLEKIDQL